MATPLDNTANYKCSGTRHICQYLALYSININQFAQSECTNFWFSNLNRKASIASHYAKLFGIEAMKTPTGYLEKHWDDPSETRYSGPCVFSLPPGFLTKEKRCGNNVANIFFNQNLLCMTSFRNDVIHGNVTSSLQLNLRVDLKWIVSVMCVSYWRWWFFKGNLFDDSQRKHDVTCLVAVV